MVERAAQPLVSLAVLTATAAPDVVTDGATGSLTDAQIAAQMDVLNVTFAGGEGGARTGFSFQLAGVTRTDNADWFYAGPGGTDEHTMKRTLHHGGNNALNPYSTTADAHGLLGRPARRRPPCPAAPRACRRAPI